MSDPSLWPSLLKKYFGYDTFRPLQREAVERVASGGDALVLMPTGGGKSLCFQLPALGVEGTALVVSPLIALMRDQVESLRANGVPAAALNSFLDENERQTVRRQAEAGELKLLYISPEGVMAELDGLLPRMHLSLVAIDEAHCVSRWGHDFRPEYTRLSVLRRRFPDVPIVALTATADKVTRSDIIDQLQLRDPQIFQTSFDRPNLSLAVRRGLTGREKVREIVRFIGEHPGESGIVYCHKRGDTEKLAAALTEQDIPAAAYHAGLPPDERRRAQDDFIHDRVPIVCATIAFGMGIDKSNVRWVVHYNMPGSVENFYQEIGRAGRDGLPADTLLFYSLGDVLLQRQFAETSGQREVNLEKLHWIQRYCETDVCRRRILLNYFGEPAAHDCGNCDVCTAPPERFDGTVLVQKALSAAVRTGERAGAALLIDILRGSTRAEVTGPGYDRLKTWGAGADMPYPLWREYIYQMIQLGYLEIDYADGNVLKVTDLGRTVLFGGTSAVLTRYRDPEELRQRMEREKEARKEQRRAERTAARAERSSVRKEKSYVAESQVDDNLLQSLKTLRRELASAENLPAYIVFSDAAIADMAARRPATVDEFLEVKGVGEVKARRYGEVFLARIREWIASKPAME